MKPQREACCRARRQHAHALFRFEDAGRAALQYAASN
jgi:hypothetical protein